MQDFLRRFLEPLVRFGLDRPRWPLGLVLAATLLFLIPFPWIQIDTDPENMLKADQPDRVFYRQVKETFALHDLIVVGLVDPQGVFRPEALEQVDQLIQGILRIPGVIQEDVMSLTTTNHVVPAGGLLEIRPPMTQVPQSPEAAQALREEIAEDPFLQGKLASADGTALAIYVPIRDKSESYRIAQAIQELVEAHRLPGQRYHLAGIPVAEDTFGHEMFLEMVVVAPLAFGLILILVYLLFRRAVFLLPVSLIALFSVVWAMGLLVGTGHTVHIMSSMIPVFLMPIAILDAVHVLSEFYDRHARGLGLREALLEAMGELYRPMLLTTLTTGVGFASLALTPIPPVQVFGVFVAFGIVAAFVLTLLVVPAVLALFPSRWLKPTPREAPAPWLDRVLGPAARWTFHRPRQVLALGLLVIVLGAVGLSWIQINDNPVKWFREGHPLRVADTEMNRLFGGTYMAYLVVQAESPGTFRNPEALSYILHLQQHLEADPLVGKTTSVADIVARIHQVLRGNTPEAYRIPNTPEAVGQFLFLYQSMGDPHDLDHFLDREARQANLWVQLRGGDNRQMEAVVERLQSYLAENPPPEGITFQWSGLTYINKVWQDLMVTGMLKAVLGSALVVLALMILSFRSLSLGVLSMIPLTLALLLSYGLAGWVGKDYDMPIAVCSSLALGLAIDFAIHFLQRYRHRVREGAGLTEAHQYLFGEPGRAFLRNGLVITLGFLPLVISHLTPYVTVGVFFALIMGVSTLTTLWLLPALLRVGGAWIFRTAWTSAASVPSGMAVVVPEERRE